MKFHGLWVHLRDTKLLISSELAEGFVVLFPTRRGDIAQVDILAPPPPPEVRTLPCASEVRAALDEIASGARRGLRLRIRNLPRPRPFGPSVEDAEGPERGVYVRLACEEAVAFTHDIIGDGSEVVEYTYDGRILGVRVHSPSTGVLFPGHVAPQFYVEIRSELEARGIQLDDLRPYLVKIDRDADAWVHPRPPAEVSGPPPRGVARVETVLARRSLRTKLQDVYGNGRLLVWRSESGRFVKADFYETSEGVDLTGLPEQAQIGPILRHHGIFTLDNA